MSFYSGERLGCMHLSPRIEVGFTQHSAVENSKFGFPLGEMMSENGGNADVELSDRMF